MTLHRHGQVRLTVEALARGFAMMGVEWQTKELNASEILAALLDEFSAVTNYRTLRDRLPGRLATLLHCRSILLYQRIGETLQFASGGCEEHPGWSAALLAVAHINPIDVKDETPEAEAWRTRSPVTIPSTGNAPRVICVPLLYRQSAIGVLVALRGERKVPGEHEGGPGSTRQFAPEIWQRADVQLVSVVASVTAMLLENARLLERDRERIHELSLLNSITSQLSCSMYELERVRSIIIARTKEISGADRCALMLPSTPPDSIEWIPPTLHAQLAQRIGQQATLHPAPLVIERSGDGQSAEYMAHLADNIKTFFAVPLVSNRSRRPSAPGMMPATPYPFSEQGDDGPHVLGMVLGAYARPCKLRREELVLLSVLANQASTILENIALMKDVVEARNKARELLRQVVDDRRLKELILESISSGLITVDMRGQITSFNHAAEEILGYHRLEAIGQSVQKILGARVLAQAISAEQAWHETLTTTQRQGHELILDITLEPLYDDRGQRIGAMATFADMTLMRHLEEERRRLDRLASLGEMAASIAHEVRNPLASIKTSMQMLSDDLESIVQRTEEHAEKTGEARQAIVVVLKEVERLDGIVRDLLLFSKPRHMHLIETSMVELCEQVLQLLAPRIAEAGVVVHRVYREVPPIKLDAAQIEQVLLNLCLNALQAMPDGGVLTISCQVVAQEPSTANSDTAAGHVYTGRSTLSSAYLGNKSIPCTWLETSVSDTGTGIAPDELELIFQPFFTTKAHGIGLGLPITRRLVEDHAGYLLVESQLGYGATVSVRLPLAPSG